MSNKLKLGTIYEVNDVTAYQIDTHREQSGGWSMNGTLFHDGTRYSFQAIVTAGGNVVAVTAYSNPEGDKVDSKVEREVYAHLRGIVNKNVMENLDSRPSFF